MTVKQITRARCHFTDDYVEIISYMGMGNYHVQYPEGDMQLAHESTLDFDGAFEKEEKGIWSDFALEGLMEEK